MPTLHNGVYAITDPALATGDDLLRRVEEALQVGLALVQYRNKDATWAQRCEEAAALNRLCKKYATPLLINDDIDLCLEVGANGVHLGQRDTKLTAARQRLGPNALIGITCHSDLLLALRAQEAGANYVAFGRFFPSQTKPNAPAADLEIVHQAHAQLAIPIVAIGGINAENGASLVNAGANMLAVIHYLMAGDDVAQRTQALRALFAL